MQNIRYATLILVAFLAAIPATAQQPVPAATAPATRFVVSTSLDAYGGLGYVSPTVEFDAGIERPLGRYFEIDGGGTYIYSRKLITGDGYTVGGGVGAIFWARPWLGLAGSIDYEYLWTSQFSKSAWEPSVGVVFRATPLGIPSRLSLSALIPTGTINKANGIESNRLKGGVFGWNAYLGSFGPTTVRLGLSGAVYQFYDQGDPICDGTDGGAPTCPRSSAVTGTASVTVSFVFPRQARAEW